MPAGGLTPYTGRVENYLRIRFDAANNIWQVTAKDGTIYSYKTLGDGPTRFRWYLSKVEDRRDNYVAYTYDCRVANAECIIQAIQYFNWDSASPVATLSFTSTSRPSTEQLTYATGKGLLANARRLAAIKVALSSGTIRAYALSYDAGEATGLSRLVRVQEYGRDAAVNADGSVTSTGIALPATMLTYSDLDLATSFDSGGIYIPPTDAIVVGDLNADGRIDWVSLVDAYAHCEMKIFGITLYTSSVACDQSDWRRPRFSGAADFDGNGTNDLRASTTNPQEITIRTFSSGSFSAHRW